MIPAAVKEFYWKEFVKSYRWEAGQDKRDYNAWKVIAAGRYTDWHLKMKKKPQPKYVDDESWEAWLEYWGTNEALAKATIKRANRLGNSGRPPSVHIGGYRSHLEYALARVKDGVIPNLVEMFLILHRKADGSFIDEKSRMVNEAIEKKRNELLALLTETGDEPVIDENRLYLDVLAEIGGTRKGRIYGIDNLASSISSRSCCSTARTSTPLPMTVEQVGEIVRNMLQEFVQQTIKQTVQQSVQQSVQQTVNAAMQQSLPQFVQTVIATMTQMNSAFVPQPSPVSANDDNLGEHNLDMDD